MPNWVSNRIEIEGKNSAEILKSICIIDKDSNELVVDFNKILPMPESLNIICGSTTDKCVEIYLTSINPDVDYFGQNKATKKDFISILKKLNKSNKLHKYNYSLSLEEINEKEKELYQFEKFYMKDILDYGKKAVDNVLNYGHMDWYNWAIANWSCKWNASDCQVYDTDAYFNTPWSGVKKLITVLSKQYPENTIIYEYAEEEAGLYAGSVTYKAGEILECNDYNEHSKEAYEMYFKLWGCEDDYIFDEKSETYKLIENENGIEM